LVAKLEGKRPLGKSRHRREDDFKTDLLENGPEFVDWTHLI
jgi:hypothetical protein